MAMYPIIWKTNYKRSINKTIEMKEKLSIMMIDTHSKKMFIENLKIKMIFVINMNTPKLIKMTMEFP